MKKLLCLLAFAAVALAGCDNKPKAEAYEELIVPETVNVDLTIVNDTIILPRIVYDIIYYDGRLLLLYPFKDKWLHVYNIAEGRIEKSVISNGRGPSEIIAGRHMSFDRKNNTIGIYDMMLRKLLTINIDEALHQESPKVDAISFKNQYLMVNTLQNNLLVYNSPSYRLPGPKTRFAFLDRKGHELNAYREYPISDSILAHVAGLTYHMDVSPDQTKMVAASGFGGIIEFFDIGGTKFKLIDRLYTSEPHMKEGDKDLLDLEKTDYCFSDLWTNDKLVYSIYGGHGYKSKTDRVVVFDWKGNPKKLYQTDYMMHLLCIDEATGTVYVITETEPEKQTIIGKFSL